MNDAITYQHCRTGPPPHLPANLSPRLACFALWDLLTLHHPLLARLPRLTDCAPPASRAIPLRALSVPFSLFFTLNQRKHQSCVWKILTLPKTSPHSSDKDQSPVGLQTVQSWPCEPLLPSLPLSTCPPLTMPQVLLCPSAFSSGGSLIASCGPKAGSRVICCFSAVFLSPSGCLACDGTFLVCGLLH